MRLFSLAVVPNGRLFSLLARTTFRPVVRRCIYVPQTYVTRFFTKDPRRHIFSLIQTCRSDEVTVEDVELVQDVLAECSEDGHMA